VQDTVLGILFQVSIAYFKELLVALKAFLIPFRVVKVLAPVQLGLDASLQRITGIMM
jgi:hypothetical protein